MSHQNWITILTDSPNETLYSINLDCFILPEEFELALFDFIGSLAKQKHNPNKDYILLVIAFTNGSLTTHTSFLYPYVDKESHFTGIYDLYKNIDSTIVLSINVE